eukprot:scaffold142566_cov67-Attheya_sp.AAC.1
MEMLRTSQAVVSSLGGNQDVEDIACSGDQDVEDMAGIMGSLKTWLSLWQAVGVFETWLAQRNRWPRRSR